MIPGHPPGEAEPPYHDPSKLTEILIRNAEGIHAMTPSKLDAMFSKPLDESPDPNDFQKVCARFDELRVPYHRWGSLLMDG
ncbi:MAG: hypothetical protein V1735_02830 [Nanoarchaeota archaeon]